MSADTFETGQRVEWDAGDDDTAGVRLGTYTKRDGAIPFFPHIVDSDDMGERRVAAGVLRPHTVAPAPAPAFPFVGARAQVTVAEYIDSAGTHWECRVVRAGDVVRVTNEPGVNGNVKVSCDDGRDGVVNVANLRPAPVSPRPDQPTDCGKCLAADKWRGKPTEHVGPDQPTEHEDDLDNVPSVADQVSVHKGVEMVREATSRIITDHARAAAEVQRLTDELDRVQRVLGDAFRAACAERDAARAELDAATTDRLGRVGDVDSDTAEDAERHAEAWTALARRRHAEEKALLRARRADEATSEDGAHA